MPYGPGSNALVTNSLPPTGDTVEEAINKLDAQFDALYDALNAAEQQVDIQFRGEWAESTTYQCNDVVTSDGATYICKNETGAPAGTAVTNTTYWGVVTKAPTTLTFATLAEVNAGTVTNKPIAPNVAKQSHDAIQALITSLTTRTTALETKTTSGTVNEAATASNAAQLNGQPGSYYRCSNNCSWTCSSACSGGCGNGCTGSCMAGCTGGCSSCTGSCTGSCSTTCTGTCTGGCSTTCTGSCKGRCQMVPN